MAYSPGPFCTLIRGQSLDAPDNFPRARVFPMRFRPKKRRNPYIMRRDGRQWTGSASSFRKLILLLSRLSEREVDTLVSFVPRKRMFSFRAMHRDRTEWNRRRGGNRRGTKRQKGGGLASLVLLVLFLARPLFCSTKGGVARLNTNDHAGSELSKVNAPIERLFTRTSAVESEFMSQQSFVQLWCTLLI